jgi:DNA mismatch repair protein MutL
MSKAFVDFFTRQVPAATDGRLTYQPTHTPVDPAGTARPDAPIQNIAPGVQSPIEAPAPGPREIDPAPAHDAQPHAPTEVVMPPARPAERVLQIHNSYVVTKDEQGLLIVDQHALHERAMFEYLLARVTGGGEGAAAALESQEMLIPVIVPASPRQIERLPELDGLLSRIGVRAEAMGPLSVGVRAFPTFLFGRAVDPGEFVRELLEKSEEDGFAPGGEETLHEVLDMMACKAAIKAGDHMSDGELRDLLHLREEIERASNCPHGRPTSIRLTIRELEKRFGRV